MHSYAVYLAVRALVAFVAALPRRAATALVDALASATYLLDRKHRRVARINLGIAFPGMPQAARDRIARRSFQLAGRNLVELSRFDSLDPARLRELVDYDPELGRNNFEIARSTGRSILYLTGHFSVWELLPTAHALFGHPLAFVTRPLDNPYLEDFVDTRRRASGNVVIAKKNSARRILELLRSGRDVGLLIDHNTSLQEGTYAELFGVPAATTTAPALLALRADVVVLPGYLTPMQAGRYRIKFLPPLELIRTGDRARDVELNTRLFNRVVESIVREAPEAWLWGHKRWKNQPDGVDLYAMSEPERERYLAGVRVKKGD